MRVGVMLPMSASDGAGRMPTWPQVRAVAQRAEVAGLDSAWVCDHLLSEPPGQPVEGVAEGWTLLAALARHAPGGRPRHPSNTRTGDRRR